MIENSILSVVLVNYNTKMLTSEVLDSIDFQADEIVVIDNASSDGSIEMLQDWQKKSQNHHLILNKDNLGFAKANNQGFKICTGKYILLLNTDTLVPAGALSKLVTWMDAHPEYGACGPKLVYPDGTVQHSPAPSPNPWMYIVRFLGLKYLAPTKAMRRVILRCLKPVLGDTLISYLNAGAEEYSDKKIEYLAGAALLVRKKVIEITGGLDEGYFMYLEDADWCIRIRRANWKLGYVHGVEILHYAGASYDGNKKGSFRSANPESYRSIMRYLANYYGPLAKGVVRICISLNLAMGIIFAFPILIFGRRAEVFDYIWKNMTNIAVVWERDVNRSSYE